MELGATAEQPDLHDTDNIKCSQVIRSVTTGSVARPAPRKSRAPVSNERHSSTSEKSRNSDQRSETTTAPLMTRPGAVRVRGFDFDSSNSENEEEFSQNDGVSVYSDPAIVAQLVSDAEARDTNTMTQLTEAVAALHTRIDNMPLAHAEPEPSSVQPKTHHRMKLRFWKRKTASN